MSPQTGKNLLANGIMLAQRHAPFIRIWIEAYRTYNGKWTSNSLEKASHISEIVPHLIHVEHGLLAKPYHYYPYHYYPYFYSYSSSYYLPYYTYYYPYFYCLVFYFYSYFYSYYPPYYTYYYPYYYPVLSPSTQTTTQLLHASYISEIIQHIEYVSTTIASLYYIVVPFIGQI